MKVLYLPGVLGSALSYQEGAADHVVWLDLAEVLGGALAYLQLAPDGVSPGPLAEGKMISAEAVFGPVYGPLAAFLQLLGYNVLALGWDWRLSLLTSAQRAWPTISAWLGTEPLRIVAHSAGGLLARAIYAQMVARGQGGQLARLITIGAPHFGSLEVVRLWWGLPTLYRALALLTGWAGFGPSNRGPAYLDDVLASMPGWYEVMAWAGVGPLHDQFPAQAAQIYTSPFYQGANAYISPNLLLSAQVVQTQLAGWLPASVMQSIAGVGERTPYALSQPGDPSTDGGYLYTQDGDGLVTLAQASPPGVPVYTLPVSHGLQPLHPLVWGQVAKLLP